MTTIGANGLPPRINPGTGQLNDDPGAPVMPQLPQVAVTKLAADTGVVAPELWQLGTTAPDLDNVNLDPAELRALDNLRQTQLEDGVITGAENKVYQEIRSLFARDGATGPSPSNPSGGSVPSVPTPPPSPQPSGLWPTGTSAANGRTFKSWGDPHETTGDGLKFDNMKVGTFVKLKSASGDFEVQTTQGRDASGRWPGATLNHKAAIKDGKDVVAYDGLAKTMSINGKQVAIPGPGQTIALPGGGSVTGTADGIQVKTSKGDVVNVHQKDNYIDISGEASANRKDGEIRGSLGTMDADTNGANDLLGRDGKAYTAKDAKSLDAFLEDWRVKPGEDLFATDPAGGGGPKVDAFEADVEAEFKARDKTGNGYLSGTEIPADFKAANPGKDRVLLAEFLLFRKKQEEAANAADKAEFAKRDINQDHQLDGNEVGDTARYDRGDNFRRPDGTTQTEVSDMEFFAGRAADRRAARWADLGGAPANPAGGAGPTGGGVPTGGGANPTGGGANPTGGAGPNPNTGGAVTLPTDDDDKKKAPPRATLRDFRQTRRDMRDFNRLDRNNDNVLTGEQTLKRFGKFDANNDGKVTAEEFLEGRAKQRAEREFKRADRNQDGTLTGTQTYAKFQGYDANNDGKVTKEEYVQGRLGQTEKLRDAAETHVTRGDDDRTTFWQRVRGQFVEKKDEK